MNISFYGSENYDNARLAMNHLVHDQASLMSYVSGTVKKFPLLRVCDISDENHFAQQRIELPNWRAMLTELLEAGYSITRIARLTGMQRRSVQRWFTSEQELPNRRLFAHILHLYCYYKYKEIKE